MYRFIAPALTFALRIIIILQTYIKWRSVASTERETKEQNIGWKIQLGKTKLGNKSKNLFDTSGKLYHNSYNRRFQADHSTRAV